MSLSSSSRLMDRVRKAGDETYTAEVVGLVAIGLGEPDDTFAWLETALEYLPISFTVGLKWDPVYDPLRSDPRFGDLLRRVGLPP